MREKKYEEEEAETVKRTIHSLNLLFVGINSIYIE